METEGNRQDEKRADPGIPDLIPVRMLNEYVYCPRLCYLEWVQGEFVESSDTLEGAHQHRRVNQAMGGVPDQGEEEGHIHASSVLLSSEQHRLIARIDLLESDGNEVVPVEYKRGSVPNVQNGIWDSDRVQLLAQVLILQSKEYNCRRGVVYYVESKSRIGVEATEERIDWTLSIRDSLLGMVRSRRIPEPLDNSPKCIRCSLAGVCLPDEVNMLKEGECQRPEVRRLVPGRQDALPLYVQRQGTYVGKKAEQLEIKEKGVVLETVRLLDISQVSVLGNVQLTTQAVRELMKRDIPVCYYTYGGWFSGLSTGLGNKNVELRMQQFRGATDDVVSLQLARWWVAGKIRNCRTMLRRNLRSAPKDVLQELARLATKAEKAESPETLLGLEGIAAKSYFSQLPNMLKPREQDVGVFQFENRNKRPPTDPVNAVLSFLYAVLVKDLTVTLMIVGFDPFLGFYHQPRYGRPALALDMMEEFRPLIGDSVLLSLVNKGELVGEDFIRRASAVALTERGRKRVLEAYERRMDDMITHPVFGYTISYRRVLEVQARLLGRFLSGEIEAYPAFTTR